MTDTHDRYRAQARELFERIKKAHYLKAPEDSFVTLIAAALAAAAQPVWTTEKPTKPGWYWHRAQYAETSCVEVVHGPAELYVRGYERDYDIDLLDGAWAGPLQPPKEQPQAGGEG